MVSNRRGPTADCGCCAPPCTCLVAKESFRGVVNTLNLTAGGFSIDDDCLAMNPLSHTFAAYLTIDYDDGFCGDSAGDNACPDIQSHFFGPVTITVDGVDYDTYVAGRNGGCPTTNGPCSIVDESVDVPALCAGFNEYGQVPADYQAAATAGIGIAYYCDGGNLGTEAYQLYLAASYHIYGWGAAVPAAPTGWTRTGSGTSYLYTRADNKSTMTFRTVSAWYSIYFCGGVFRSNSLQIWQLSAFTYDDNVTTLTLDYPFDPAGIFNGIQGDIT